MTPFAGVILAGDVNAGLFVEPPAGKSEVVGYRLRLFQDDPVRHEHGIDVRVTRTAS